MEMSSSLTFQGNACRSHQNQEANFIETMIGREESGKTGQVSLDQHFERHRQWKKRRRKVREYRSCLFVKKEKMTSVVKFVVFVVLSSCLTAVTHSTTSMKSASNVRITSSRSSQELPLSRVMKSSVVTSLLPESKSTFHQLNDDAEDAPTDSTALEIQKSHSRTVASSDGRKLPSGGSLHESSPSVTLHSLDLFPQDSTSIRVPLTSSSQDILSSIIPSTSHTLTFTPRKTETAATVIVEDQSSKRRQENKSAPAKEWITSKSGFLSLLQSLNPCSSNAKKSSHEVSLKGFSVKEEKEMEVDFEQREAEKVERIITTTGEEDGRSLTTKSHPQLFNREDNSKLYSNRKRIRTTGLERMNMKTKIDTLGGTNTTKEEKNTEGKIMKKERVEENLLFKPRIRRIEKQTERVRRTDFERSLGQKTARQTANSKTHITTGSSEEKIYNNRQKEDEEQSLEEGKNQEENVEGRQEEKDPFSRQLSNIRRVSSSELSSSASSPLDVKRGTGEEKYQGNTITVSLVGKPSFLLHDGNNNNRLSRIEGIKPKDEEQRLERLLIRTVRDNNDGQDALPPESEGNHHHHLMDNHGHEYNQERRQDESIYTYSSSPSSTPIDMKEKGSSNKTDITRKEEEERDATATALLTNSHDSSQDVSTDSSKTISSSAQDSSSPFFLQVSWNPHSRQRRDGESERLVVMERDSLPRSIDLPVQRIS
jgi:hypothetical protein